MKTHTLLIIALCFIVIFCFVFAFYQNQEKSSENCDFFVVSTGDSNGVDTIIGIRTSQAIGEDADQVVYPIESLDNGDYFNLRYPFQSENRIYYTTTDAVTGEECIVSKSNTAPEWNDDSTYYRKQTDWKIILKKPGRITYKKVFDNLIYYLLVTDTAEIRCYDMSSKTDELLISNISPTASFDVHEDGTILYVNEGNSIVLHDVDGTERELGKGTTACFWVNAEIFLVNSSGASILSLTDGKSKKICSVTGTAIMVSPSKTYIALYDESDYKNLEYGYINIIDIATGRICEIKSIPNCIYGMAWFDDYYPIS